MVTNISTPDCNFITAIANSTSVGERIVMANDGDGSILIGLDCVSVMVCPVAVESKVKFTSSSSYFRLT